MSSNSASGQGQLGFIATILAGVSYAIAPLVLFGDAIENWGKDLQSQYPPDVPLGTFADFVTGLGMSTSNGSIAWAIGFGSIGVAFTITAILNKKKLG